MAPSRLLQDAVRRRTAGGAMVLAALLLALAAAPQARAQSADVRGVWLTDGGKSHVEIIDCGARLCGSIIWLKEPNDEDGVPKTDRNNPDEALQERPIIGLPLLSGFERDGDEPVWKGGKIYNPEDGKTYSATMTLVNERKLKVRGYVGLPLFGKSQLWSRVRQ